MRIATSLRRGNQPRRSLVRAGPSQRASLRRQRPALRARKPQGGLQRLRAQRRKLGSTGGAGLGSARSRAEWAVQARSATFRGRTRNIDAGRGRVSLIMVTCTPVRARPVGSTAR
jgi:hypothetical protein